MNSMLLSVVAQFGVEELNSLEQHSLVSGKEQLLIHFLFCHRHVCECKSTQLVRQPMTAK